MIQETLLANASIPAHHFIAPDTTLPLELCVEHYNQALEELFEQYRPDIMTLGLGEDGHIASLFPPVPEEGLTDDRTVIHTQTERFAVLDRISLTLPVIRNASHLVYFLKGEGKMTTWNTMLESDQSVEMWPTKGLLEHSSVHRVVYP